MLFVLSLASLFFSVVSQSLMDLVGTFFILYSFYLINKNQDLVFRAKAILKSNYFIFFYAWVLWVLISFLFGASNYDHLIARVLEFRWMIYVFCYLYVLEFFNQDYFKIFIFSLAGMCFLSLHIYFTDMNYVAGNPFMIGVAKRAGGFLNDPMTLAHGLGLLVAFILGYCSKMKIIFNKYILFSLLFILIAILMTMTRGVWIAVITSFTVYFFIKSWKQAVLFCVFVLMLAGIGFSVSSNFRSRIEQTMQFKSSFDNERVVLWETNWYIIKNNPVFGIGYGENKHRVREFYDLLNVPVGQFEGNAHNQYLNFLAGTGVIGLLFYLIWIFTNLYWAFVLSNNLKVSLQVQALGFGSFLAQVVFLVGGLTESNFEHSKIKTIITFFWAISFYGYYLVQTKKQEGL
ncbi:MAG: O-antigen ligase family protein [Pseudobdellovibrio sp.]